MWIGAIRLVVQTKDAPYAGTDSTVQIVIMRDGEELRTRTLNHDGENDLERGATRNYDYRGETHLPRRNDETEELPDNIVQNPMPHPSYGFEFSNGLEGHLTIKLRITGQDMWIKDKVDLYVVFIRRRATSFDTEEWQEDSNWTFIHSWTQDVEMSTDSSEGRTTWKLNVN